ncbi:hypothetical protein [Aureimonas phyllosphaerae]|uniref:Uncharacterized protein n=1 Tax=Aureimonas phyllosphaerae TaxID=1166078 RepID=A0A7W6C0W4_9HYPH|nr:hypothetical protein [Aureimonas phyllosphaerae]MBB3937361.1 hypothetical protein [Aureimonas phyllosphaerae]MBB3961368.1 hypothetical protein [Aureimonas phyllosphaerae]SFF42306.1 hypothetical protein SAMN05216566_11279 [Aureimonas phyllosphaerae]
MRLATLVLGAALAWTGAAHTADFSSRNAPDPIGTTALVITLGGAIVDGDVERFGREASKSSPDGERVVVELRSPGGSYVEGLLLAAAFRRAGAATVVRGGAECYSACALAFLGGAEPLRDVGVEGDDIPNQPPSRTLEPGGTLGFHAPYLDVPEASYSSATVGEAYRAAVDGISLLIQLADRLYVEPTELPRLLEPDRNAAFMVDTVDAVRSLWIDYADRSLQFRNLPSITPSMVRNACINRWYHRQRRSALPGYGIATRAMRDFEEGSELLDNGEVGLGFGVRTVRQGTKRSWVAFTPITMTPDGKEFLWCVFDSGLGSPRVLYRAAGTVEELFEPLGDGDFWEFSSSEGIVNPDADVGVPNGMLIVMDTVPADTPLAGVASVVASYQSEEKGLAAGR